FKRVTDVLVISMLTKV
ncbi:aminotransferase class-III family protein, partial [Vibrio parahaemolyticus V-223/04]